MWFFVSRTQNWTKRRIELPSQEASSLPTSSIVLQQRQCWSHHGDLTGNTISLHQAEQSDFIAKKSVSHQLITVDPWRHSEAGCFKKFTFSVSNTEKRSRVVIFSRGDIAKPRLYSWNNRAREGILLLQKTHIKCISLLESLALCISGGNLQTVERFGHKIAQKRLL